MAREGATSQVGSVSGTAERRLRRVIVAAAVTQGAINVDFFAMGVALPRMAGDLDTTATSLQWVVSGYLIALAAFSFFAVAGFGLGLGWAYASVSTQAVVPPEKAGAASGVVLTALVGIGGIAVASAASVIESRSAAGAGPAIQELIRASGVVALVGAAAVALFGRDPAPSRSRTSGLDR